MELAADRIAKQLPAPRIKAGAMKEEAKALAEEAVKALLPEGVSANVEILAFQSSDTAQEAQFVSAIIYRQVKVQLMQNAPVIPLPGLWRKQEKGSDGSGGSGGGGGSRSAGNVSSTEQHRPSVVDEQAQWVQNGTGWKLTLSSGEVAADRLGYRKTITGTT